MTHRQVPSNISSSKGQILKRSTVIRKHSEEIIENMKKIDLKTEKKSNFAGMCTVGNIIFIISDCIVQYDTYL